MMNNTIHTMQIKGTHKEANKYEHDDLLLDTIWDMTVTVTMQTTATVTVAVTVTRTVTVTATVTVAMAVTVTSGK